MKERLPSRTAGREDDWLPAEGISTRRRQALLIAVALWPVSGYLARAYLAPGAELSGAIVLLLVLCAVAWLHGRSPSDRRAGPDPIAVLCLGFYALGFAILPPLARALLGVTAFAAALIGLPGVGWRKRSGFLPLMVLALPAQETLSFFLGGPLRALSAALASGWLRAGGADARADGPALWVGERLFCVDVPCSGVNGLWAGMVVAAVLATWRGLSVPRTVLLLAAAAALCVPINAWRVVGLAYLSRLGPHGGPGDIDTVHAGVGLVCFAFEVALLAGLSQVSVRLWGRSLARQSSRRRCRLLQPALPLVVLAAALAPLIPTGPSHLPATTGFPGWPDRWCGVSMRRLPSSALDRRWAAALSGPLARFALPDGHELLLRWVERPGRGLHPAEECYRGQGYRITALPPLRAPLPELDLDPPVDRRMGLWGRFRAERANQSWEVRCLLLSQTGVSYTDPAWWWWRVAGPWATDHGPWWSITLQIPEATRMRRDAASLAQRSSTHPP